MPQFVSFLAALALCVLALPAFAQSGETPQWEDGGSTTSISTTAEGGVPTEIWRQEEPVATPPPASSTEAGTAPVSTTQESTTPHGSPRSAPVQTVTPVSPRSPSTMMPAPKEALPSPTPPPLPKKSAPVVFSESEEPLAPASEDIDITVPLLLGALSLLFAAGFALSVKRKNDIRRKDPCGALKKQFDVAKTAYDLAVKKITLQELLLAELKEQLENLKEELKAQAMEPVYEAVSDVKEKILEQEKSGRLKKAVHIAQDTKALYDDLSKKYEVAKDALAVLRARQKGLANRVREREALFSVCMQGLTLADSSSGNEQAIVLPTKSSGEKTIIVDASAFIEEHGHIIPEMYALLERYPNKKIILTDDHDAQGEKRNLPALPYEQFVRRHDLEKTEGEQYVQLLDILKLQKENVLYITNTPRSAKSAQEVGITTYHQDVKAKELDEIVQFLNEHL